MSAKAKVTQTTKTRQKKIPEGNLKCNMCSGKGYVPKGYNKKKN